MMKARLLFLTTGLFCVSCKPDPVPDSGTPPAADTPDPAGSDSYLGLDEKAAGDMADKAGLKWRIIEIDGEPLPATSDYQPQRLNFAIQNGKVIRVTQG